MNVYEKLQKCRVELQNTTLKKSGHNKFAGYTYFELGDFLPTINKLCLENKLLTVTKFDSEIATLEVINAEAPEEKVVFTSPQGSAQLKGCHDIQNIGAVETYQRRYLMMLAFEIVEGDALDPTVGQDKSQSKEKQTLKRETTDKQLDELYSVAQKAGYDMQAVDKQVKKKFGCKTIEMPLTHYNVMLNGYKKLLEEKEGK